MKFQITDPSNHLWTTSSARSTFRDVGKDALTTLRLGTPALVFARRKNSALIEALFSAIINPTA